MIIETFNAFEISDVSPAKAGTSLFFATRGLFSETPTREFVDLWQATVQAPPPVTISVSNLKPAEPAR